jgi:hypothetical protein
MGGSPEKTIFLGVKSDAGSSFYDFRKGFEGGLAPQLDRL